MSTEPQLYEVPEGVRAGSASPMADMNGWRRMWLEAATDPDAFWLARARENVAWRTEPTRGLDGDFHTVKDGPISWFADGELNVNDSCVDRHAAAQPDKVAILWEGDEPGDVRRITYRELHAAVCRCANVLDALGVKKGDRVIVYMGMVPEAAVAMLACARS